MNVGSLFAGIGGFDLGLERAGMRTLWQVEKEPFRRAVLARHFPDAERFEDVCDVGAHNLPWVDVICGGFPCQDLSVAGLRAGIDGARSGLWVEFARIIRELRPRYVIVENVANLLVRGLERVLGDLAESGYDAEWDCLPASAFGAPHRRDRIWIVAYPSRDAEAGPAPPTWTERQRARAGGERGGAVPDAAGNGRRSRGPGRSDPGGQGQRELALQVVADTHPQGQLQPGGLERKVGRLSGNGGGAGAVDEGRPMDDALRGRHGPPEGQVPAGRDGALDAGWWSAEPNVGRVADGIPARVDRLSALGDALVPQIAEWIGNRLMSYEKAAA